MSKAGKVITSVVVAAIYLLIYYITLPTLSLRHQDGYWFIAIGVIAICIIVSIWRPFQDEVLVLPAIATGVVFVVYLILIFFNSALFTSNSRYQQIGTFEEKSFTEDVLELDTSQIPVVDIEYARRLADKRLGEDAGLGSQMTIGEFTNKQQINGKLYYVAPLEYRGFFKWLHNRATPGYVIVSCTNTNDVKLVLEHDDKPLQLKYVNTAWFGEDLKRHLHNSGYATTALTEYSFELDDTGYPYWVVTTYANKHWGSCGEATGVVICDPQTGATEWYSVDEAPEWVDIIQPESFVVKQLENYGTLIHGPFNFSQRDELSVTKYVTTVFNNGDCYYYTGMSSKGGDQSTVGFVMVNTRTKEVKMYHMNGGATESAAMQSANGATQNYGYKATQPIPLNISGIPTYFCTMKDDSGLVKTYCMVCIENYSIVKTDESLASLKRSYINAVSTSGQSMDFSQETYSYSITGVVTRISANVESGETVYYLIIDEDSTKIFVGSYVVSDELPITREGDTVTVTYLNDNNGVINIITFDNVAFSTPVSEGQASLNQDQANNNPISSENSSIVSVDPDANTEFWDSLTEEEKADIINSLN